MNRLKAILRGVAQRADAAPGGRDMHAALTFKAASDGEPYGVILLSGGIATARTRREVLTGALLGHAIMWIRERNPRPHSEVTVTLANGSTPGG